MAELQTNTDAGEMTQIFVEWVMMQSQNTALCLGLIDDPRYGRQPANIPMAQMFIEQLAVIRQKTAGNLLPNEQKVIDSALREMQTAFVQVTGQIDVPGGSFTDAPAPPVEAPAPPAAKPPPPPAPVATAPAPEREPEESKKRFTKSYGA